MEKAPLCKKCVLDTQSSNTKEQLKCRQGISNNESSHTMEQEQEKRNVPTIMASLNDAIDRHTTTRVGSCNVQAL